MSDLFALLSRAAYSRFHQQGNTSYCCENILSFPRINAGEGYARFEVTSTSSHHGVQSRLVVSGLLYSNWIRSGSMTPEHNIASLCHAFLYAVDLDLDASEELSFGVPYFHPGKPFGLVPVRARICCDDRKEYIFIQLAEE
jgi:hypothetical protein